MTLFSTSDLKTKPGAAARDRRRRRRIPTGEPRLVESSRVRVQQDAAAAWEALLNAIRKSAEVRLSLLRGRSGSDRLACPWERFNRCAVGCRCHGTRRVSVALLREHYTHLASEIEMFACPVRPVRQRKVTK